MKSHPHPERPDRLRAIAASLATAAILPLIHMLMSIQHVLLGLQQVCVLILLQQFFSGRAKNGFALVRPPGHHAGVRQSMGFCLHNNAAVVALAAQATGAKKVLIVDWVLYISLHRHEGGRFYPGTGAAKEVGSEGAEGYCVNVPWSRGGVGENDYVFAFQNVVLPIGNSCWLCTDDTYVECSLWWQVACYSRGYNLRSISSSATSVIKVLLGENPGCKLDHSVPSKAGLQTVLEVLKIQTNFWRSLESNYAKLQSQWEVYLSENKRKQIKKVRRAAGAPLWWKWGRKRLLYRILNGHFRLKSRGC